MLSEPGPEGQTVALYWDFENIHGGLCERKEPGAYARGDFRFKPQEPLVNVQAVVDLAASFGPIAINRAYCNWQFFGRYRDQLLQNAVELIQLFPPGGAAKNGADIKLCLDAMEDISRFRHIGTVMIVGGDSDFMPVSQKIKAAGRVLIGVGTRPATNRHWAKSCHEFRYYETLVEVAEVIAKDAELPVAAALTTGSHLVAAEERGPSVVDLSAPLMAVAPEALRDILRRALRLMADKKKEPWINKAEIGPMIKWLEATFDLAEHGYASFSAMLKAFEEMLEVRKVNTTEQVRLR
jgi:uncharacterized LabA/DUF88 family protein